MMHQYSAGGPTDLAYISAAFAEMVGRPGSAGTVPHGPTFHLSDMVALGESNFLHRAPGSKAKCPGAEWKVHSFL